MSLVRVSGSPLQGISKWYRILLGYPRIYRHRRKVIPRIPPYEIWKKPCTLTDLGLVARDIEYQVENPQKDTKNNFCDGIHFIGVDTEKNFLDVAINNIGDDVANIWIVLKLSDGSHFELPHQPDTRVSYMRNEDGFIAGGLRIHCHAPLRRWRISFNGMLRKVDPDDYSKSQQVYVKFSFIWMSFSLIHDNAQHYNSYELAKSFASKKRIISEKDLNHFEKIRSTYEQWGQLMGTVQEYEEPERELYLWSVRERHLENPIWDSSLNFVKVFMYFQDGTPLKLEVSSLEDMHSFFDGYTVAGGGKENAISSCSLKLEELSRRRLPKDIYFTYNDTVRDHNVVINRTDFKFSLFTGHHKERTLNFNYIKATLDGEENGYGIIISGFESPKDVLTPFVRPEIILKDKNCPSSKNVRVLSFDHESCQSSLVAGGKGCSLALLTTLSEHSSDFTVPKGFVITTEAFKEHIKTNSNLYNAVEKLKKSSSEQADILKNECEKCSQEFEQTELSQLLKSEIASAISNFNQNDHVKFAVRSSALGEDSEDLSAAGQMLSVLGVKGIDNIYKAIARCWSSHFRYEAVQYNRQHGQPLDSLMAVVVQEMVSPDVAGVMFTVDPFSGNPTYPHITANFGLGETVVSSSAEPDTYILKRFEDGSLDLSEVKIGKKGTKMIMLDSGGTEEISSKSLNESCLTKEMALQIGKAGLCIEKYFRGPRDIEWAIKGDNLFLLQARPITTIHSETEFEVIHELDTPVRSSYEYWTRANTGEVFYGACSPLGISLIVFGMDFFGQRNVIVKHKPKNLSYVPYFSHWLPATHRQICLSIIDTLLRANEKKISRSQKAIEIALFGRPVISKQIHKCGVKKYGCISWYEKAFSMMSLILSSFRIVKLIDAAHERVWNISMPLESFTKPTEAYDSIKELMQIYGEVSGVHGIATFLSSFYNVLLMSCLAKGKEAWDNELYCDFANLLSTCSDVESADVPSSLQNLAKTIHETDSTAFASAPVEVAYSLLKNDKGVAGELFKTFLYKHGHRCLKEFDLYSVSWGMEPENLVKTLQNMVASPKSLSKRKEATSTADAINKLNTPLSTSSKLLLELILPWSRKAVGYREKTKSIIIKMVDLMRQSCHRLSYLLVQEGFLPKEELLYFLTFDEIKLLMETRNPNLVTRAVRRCRIHPKLETLKFPEIINGIPKPEKDDDSDLHSSVFELKGTPVCPGRVQGKVRVVLSLDKAAEIKQGEILVAYSTDIGWSPYFPLVSGVITVLGGLISHGAVVAREYGLPCVVGVQKATSILRTGDIIILDGSKGTITKLKANVNTKEL